MKKALIAVVAAIVIICGAYLAWSYVGSDERAPTEPTGATTSQATTSAPITRSSAPSFHWGYEQLGKAGEDEIPRAKVSLTARYADGTETTKEIDTIDGSCNTYTDYEPGIYPRSQMIICYYAGFGRYYKVVESEGAYLVQRREFEEATPDHDPPQQEFQTIARF